MNDIINEDEIITPKSDYDNVSLKMGIISIIMVPMAIYFFTEGVALFGFAFLLGSPLIAIFGLMSLKNYKQHFVFFSQNQIKKFKVAKIICIIALCIGLLTIFIGIFLFIILSKLH